MLKVSIFLVAVLMVGLAGGVQAQDASFQRARDLAAALDKEKYKKKEKRDISIEIYINIKNEAAVRDASAYTGVYVSEDHKLDLRVSSSGQATGSGYDDPMSGGGSVKYDLRDARVDGAVLTGVKVYTNGETRKFEAVFVNRTVSTGKNKDNIESQETSFGLGYVEGGAVIAGDKTTTSWTNRVFLERKN